MTISHNLDLFDRPNFFVQMSSISNLHNRSCRINLRQRYQSKLTGTRSTPCNAPLLVLCPVWRHVCPLPTNTPQLDNLFCCVFATCSETLPFTIMIHSSPTSTTLCSVLCNIATTVIHSSSANSKGNPSPESFQLNRNCVWVKINTKLNDCMNAHKRYRLNCTYTFWSRYS